MDPVDDGALAAAYALLARLFAFELDEAVFHQLATDPAHPWLDAADCASPSEGLQRASVDYWRLFIGPPPVCPPYVSALRGEVLLGGRARKKLEAFLERAGLELELDALRVASPDHVSVYFAVLTNLRGSSEPRDAELCRELVHDLVLPWAVQFFEAVERHAECSVYRAAAQLGKALMDEEQAKQQQASRKLLTW